MAFIFQGQKEAMEKVKERERERESLPLYSETERSKRIKQAGLLTFLIRDIRRMEKKINKSTYFLGTHPSNIIKGKVR